MSKNELMDYIKSNKINSEKKYEKNIDILNDEVDLWLINQFNVCLKDELQKIDKLDKKISFLNKLSQNSYGFQNHRIYNSKNFPKEQFDKITYNENVYEDIYKKIKYELLNCTSAILVSPFINIDINMIKDTIENNYELEKLTIVTTIYNKDKIDCNFKLLKKIKALSPSKINIYIEDVNENYKRLHTKGYYFGRSNNLSSLYIGSSNLSRTGFKTGNEYNIKVSEFSNKYLIKEFLEYVNNFIMSKNIIEISDREKIAKLEMLQLAQKQDAKKILEAIKIYNNSTENEYEKIGYDEKVVNEKFSEYFEKPTIELFGYQESVLNSLIKRRKDGHKKHLVVMATGTGKTIVALEYVNRLIINNENNKLKVLFLTNRREILNQTVRSFVNLSQYEKNDICELYDGIDHIDDLVNKKLIFGSVQTLYNNIEKIKEYSFDLVIFDEVHHMDIETKMYRELFLLAEKNGSEILGLTATPIRTNGSNVLSFFDGDFAYDLPLNKALKNGLLSPFDYYLLYSDEIIDFNIEKDKNQLTKFLNNDNRKKILLDIISKHLVDDIENVKCVIFCSSIENAENTSDFLIRNGFKSSHLSSRNDLMSRRNIIDNFTKGSINFLLVVDIFNEGIDIPQINTIIFLRPTSSKLIFVQQLGRGLRKLKNKVLKVFDIVNNISIKKNKNYNPLNYLSEVAHFKESIGDIISNPKIIDYYMPFNCNFYINKEDNKSVSRLLREIDKSDNNFIEAIKNYKDKSFDSYCEFIKSSYRDPAHLYDNGYSFLEAEDSWVKKGLFLISTINIREILVNIKNIIANKSLCKNNFSNLFLLKSYFNTSNKINVNSIEEAYDKMFCEWNPFFTKEMEFLCEYRLKYSDLYENKITNDIESLRNIKISNQLLSVIVANNPLTYINKGANVQGGLIVEHQDLVFLKCERSIEKNNITFHKEGYENYIDYENGYFYWSAPRDIKFNQPKAQKLVNKRYKKIIFFMSKYDIVYKTWSVFTFIGTSDIGEIVSEDIGKISYKFKIN